jgi:hypothetical protein
MIELVQRCRGLFFVLFGSAHHRIGVFKEPGRIYRDRGVHS